MCDIPDFKIISSWNNDSVKFSHIFIIEFTDANSSYHYINSVSKDYKIKKKKFVKYLKKYGNESETWIISKHRGPYNHGAALMVGFNNKYSAIEFMLDNS